MNSYKRLLALLALIALAVAGCGGDEEEPTVGIGQACLDVLDDQVEIPGNERLRAEVIVESCSEFTGDTPVDEAVAAAEKQAETFREDLDRALDRIGRENREAIRESPLLRCIERHVPDPDADKICAGKEP